MCAARRRISPAVVLVLSTLLHCAEGATINAVTAKMGSMAGGTYLRIAGAGFSLNGIDGQITVCVSKCAGGLLHVLPAPTRHNISLLVTCQSTRPCNAHVRYGAHAVYAWDCCVI